MRKVGPETALQGLGLDRPRAVPDREPKNLVKPVRVLHVLDHSWPLLSGYSVRSHSLIAAQRSIGFLPEAITSPLHQLDDLHSPDATVEGISFRRTPLPRGLARHALGRRFPLLRGLAVVRLLRDQILSQLDQVRFDLVHAHSPALCGLAALQATRARGVPLVYEIRAFWEDAAVDQHKTHPASLHYHLSRRLEGYVAEKADAVVGISQHILDDLEGRGLAREKLFHVPNGVDADRFAALPRDNQLATELDLKSEPVMGFIGSLYRYEGVAWLVRAGAKLRRRGVPLQILIVGQGEDMPEILAAIRETEAQDYVHLTGQVPHDQVQRYYSLMDVMVYPRWRIRLTELTTPLKPLEAMAQGKAVLASNIGGVRELVGPGDGCLLFDPDDVEDFCRKATRLLLDERFRQELGENGRLMIFREKDWKVVVRSYEAVYDFARLRKRSFR